MFRGCVSSLVIVGLLASFLAAVPHVHAGMSAEERREHDASHHVHHFLLGHAHHDHDHGHDHHHHGASHHDHRQDAGQSKSPESPASLPVVPEGTLTAPDEDYGVRVHAPMPLAAGHPGQSFAKAFESQVLIATDSLPTLHFYQVPQLDVHHAGKFWCDGSGLYLALRHLRL